MSECFALAHSLLATMTPRRTPLPRGLREPTEKVRRLKTPEELASFDFWCAVPFERFQQVAELCKATKVDGEEALVWLDVVERIQATGNAWRERRRQQEGV